MFYLTRLAGINKIYYYYYNQIRHTNLNKLITEIQETQVKSLKISSKIKVTMFMFFMCSIQKNICDIYRIRMQ